MSIRTYKFGYFMGTALRECIRACRQSAPNEQVAKTSAAQHFTSSSVLSPAQVESLCQTPALARKGVNLNDWFNANVHVCVEKSKKRRPRKSAAQSAQLPEQHRFGPLNELIA